MKLCSHGGKSFQKVQYSVPKFPAMEKFDAQEGKIKTTTTKDYSSRFFWRSHLDVIAAFTTFLVFCLIISILSFAGGMDPQVSQLLTNFKPAGEDILVFGAIISVFVFLLLLLPLFISATSSKFSEYQESEYLYIQGINLSEETEDQPLPSTIPSPSQTKDKLGSDEEGKWTFNGTSKAEMLGKDHEEKWTYGRIQKLDDTQV